MRRTTAMADEVTMALLELLRKAGADGEGDFLREVVRVLAEAVMDAEVTQQRQAPRVRDGSYYPTLLEPRRRAERALLAVVQEAYVQGISTRRVDELVQA